MPRRKAEPSVDRSNAVVQSHSPLGGSSAERYIHCSGSVYLKEIFPGDDDASEFSVEGTEAHKIAAKCLTTGEELWESGVSVETARAIQVYLDYASARAGTQYVEFDLRHPAFHPQAFGRLDLAIFEPRIPGHGENFIEALEIVDYKHGVQVAATGNAQLRSYAQWFIDGETWPSDRPRLASSDLVRLTIVQPRGFRPAEPIRSEVLTVGELSKWSYDVLRPAMQKAGEQTYSMGSWCHFCPRKLMCPPTRELAMDAVIAVKVLEDDALQQGKEGGVVDTPAAQLGRYDDAWLDEWYGRLEMLNWFKKAVMDETHKRVLAGSTAFTNAKLVNSKVNRIWKVAAEDELYKIFGEQSQEPVSWKSPAKIEKLPGGADFVKEWSYQPPAELTVAPASDTRRPQRKGTAADIYTGISAKKEKGLTADEW